MQPTATLAMYNFEKEKHQLVLCPDKADFWVPYNETMAPNGHTSYNVCRYTVYRECFACINCLRFAIILCQRKDLTRIVLPLQSFRARAWMLQRMNR